MITLETLFEKYQSLRLDDYELEQVYEMMREDVVSNLTREERNILAIQCKEWESERTHINLSRIQQEAIRRSVTTNTTIKITFCPACDAPNAEGFTRCQVCDEPLAVSHTQANTTTGIMKNKRGVHFERDSRLVLKVANATDRLVLQPQLSPTGLKIGRRTDYTSICDVDLVPFGGNDYGISRVHASIRYDRTRDLLMITDLNSTNGTFINGVRIPPQMESKLSDGDDLRLGRMPFVVKFK
ncbi:MAG: FHA domain-containing protein [Anaerolineae bacterium]